MTEKPLETNTPRANEAVVCDVCGRFGAIELGERQLCLDCYEGCGSCCCPEFGREEAETQSP
jgi:hypothetical protein